VESPLWHASRSVPIRRQKVGGVHTISAGSGWLRIVARHSVSANALRCDRVARPAPPYPARCFRSLQDAKAFKRP